MQEGSPEVEPEPVSMDSKIEALTESLASVHVKLNRMLAILDSRENKRQKDRKRIKQKRDEENASEARQAGKIVVDRLEGTLYTDPRLPYKLWAYILLEFKDAREFLRWMMHEYLESYYCIRDSRRRMIVRKGNHWKMYKKGCGTEKLVTPADMFGGHTMRWDKMLDLLCFRWCHVHVRPVIEHVCNIDRLEHVHGKELQWNCPTVNADCGDPLPLEARWWKKHERFREIMHSTLGVYGGAYIRTAKGPMLLDYEESTLKRREVVAVIKNITEALQAGVNNRATHAAWMKTCNLQKFVDKGIAAHNASMKEEAHVRFMEQLHKHRDRCQVNVPAVRMGMELAAAAREEHDIQKAIEASLGSRPNSTELLPGQAEEKSDS